MQPGGPPVWLGAQSKWSFARVADYCDGWMPIGIMGGLEEGMAALRSEAEKAGRDFDAIQKAVFAASSKEDEARQLLEMGFEDLMFPLPSAGEDTVLPLLDRYAELARKLR